MARSPNGTFQIAPTRCRTTAMASVDEGRLSQVPGQNGTVSRRPLSGNVLRRFSLGQLRPRDLTWATQFDDANRGRAAWNTGKKVGTRRPFTQKQIRAIRFFLDRERRVWDRVLFDLAIDSKLRGCDLVKIRIRDVVAGSEIRSRATAVQQKTGRPVQFEITSDVRASLLARLERRGGTVED